MIPAERAFAIDRLAALTRVVDAPSDVYLATARAALTDLVAQPDLFAGVPLSRTPGGYARNLLVAAGDFGVWAIVWSPGARTSVHDHHCSCCFAVLRGTLQEIWFRPVGAHEAVATAEATRRPGYVGCMMPSGPNLHQMVNDGADEAISIHIYGYDPTERASSVDKEYRVVRV